MITVNYKKQLFWRGLIKYWRSTKVCVCVCSCVCVGVCPNGVNCIMQFLFCFMLTDINSNSTTKVQLELIFEFYLNFSSGSLCSSEHH